MDSNNWYALYVRSRHEKSVSAQLEAKQHEVFLPLYTARHKWADRWKNVTLPLFQGYVFCRFQAQKRSAVLTTTGVIDVVRIGSEPAEIDSAVIESIQAAVKSPLMTEPYTGLVEGQQVIMTGGPLTGVRGRLVKIKESLRFVISVELLNRSVLVEIESDWIVPCEPEKPLFVRAIEMQSPQACGRAIRPLVRAMRASA